MLIEWRESAAGAVSLEALSGRDGARLWETNFPSSLIWAPVDGEASSQEQALLTVSGDLPPWWLEGAHEENGYGPFSAPQVGFSGVPFDGNIEVRLLRGSDGKTVYSRSFGSSSSHAQAAFAGDASGDGLVDALIRIDSVEDGSTTLMVSGGTGLATWRFIEEDAFLYPLRADLDGDHADDVAVLSAGAEGIAYLPISGRNATSIWDAPKSAGMLLSLSSATSGDVANLFESRIFEDGSQTKFETALRGGKE